MCNRLHTWATLHLFAVARYQIPYNDVYRPMVNFAARFHGSRRMNVRHCTDPLIGDILAGWRYDISGVSPTMRTDYDQHLTDCAHCRRSQHLARTIDVLLLSVTSMSWRPSRTWAAPCMDTCSTPPSPSRWKLPQSVASSSPCCSASWSPSPRPFRAWSAKPSSSTSRRTSAPASVKTPPKPNNLKRHSSEASF